MIMSYNSCLQLPKYSPPQSSSQPLVAQTHQVIREFLNSQCSIARYDIFTIVSDEDSLCRFADNDALFTLKVLFVSLLTL
jgi:hypothetical protein